MDIVPYTHYMWSREASSAAPGATVEGGLVRPGSQHSAALRHFFEHLLNRLLFDESPIELVEPSADALLALVLADEVGFSELIQQVRAYVISATAFYSCSDIHVESSWVVYGSVRTMCGRVYRALVADALSGRILRREAARALWDPHDIQWTDALVRPAESHARERVWHATFDACLFVWAPCI